MEQSFPVAFWMLLLVGFLHAKSMPPFCIVEADVDNITDVTCENMTFVTPADIQRKCYRASLTTFMNGLLQANKTCKGDGKRTILATLEQLEDGQHLSCVVANGGAPASECSWEKEEFRKPFDTFASAIRLFIQQLNNRG